MDKYAIAEHKEDSDWAEEYSMLKGPNGFECCLTEPEDRTWYRDGADVIQELNRLLTENERLREVIEGALRIKDLWLFQSEEEQYRHEAAALATMLYNFEQALK